MQFNTTDSSFASALDAQDELAPFRDAFIIDDPDLIYLDGNSLGRLPKRTVTVLHDTVRHAWGERLIRSWDRYYPNPHIVSLLTRELEKRGL